MIFFSTFIKTFIEFIIKVWKRILKKLNKSSPKTDNIFEIADIILSFCWLILLPMINWTEVIKLIE